MRRNLVERRREPSLRFLCFTRQRNQLQSRFVRDAWRMATALALANALDTVSGNALAPQADRLYGYPKFPRDHRMEWPSWAHNAMRARITSRCAAVFRSITIAVPVVYYSPASLALHGDLGLSRQDN